MANKERPLTIKEKAFCREYVKTGNATQAIYKAGYNYKTDNAASTTATRLLQKAKIQKEIQRLLKPKEDKAIADAQEVMEYFSKVMRGEIKDQFGLEAPLSERTKAAQEIAKRTVDIDNKAKGLGENDITIKLDWRKEE